MPQEPGITEIKNSQGRVEQVLISVPLLITWALPNVKHSQNNLRKNKGKHFVR
jgi:hypothetical protein